MARLAVILYGILGLSWRVGCANKYDNYTLVRLLPTDDDQLNAMMNFEDPEGKVEVLKRTRGLNDSIDMLVPPDKVGQLERFANEMAVTFHERTNNYGRNRSLEADDRMPRRRVMRDGPYFRYNSHQEIEAYLQTMAKKYPRLITLQHLGNSYEGRSITLVKISKNPNAGNPIIFIDAGIHAREWVAPAMALYLIHRLANDAASGERYNDGVDWLILPLVNPDGYEFTRSNPNNRMWRKTRSKYKTGCYGVDGNRNYGFKWGVSGVSSDPCHKETYAGPAAFSEIETKLVRDVMMQHKKNLKLYISLHAYGQYLVYPWGYTGNFLPKSWKNLHHLAKSVSAAIVRAGGRPYKVLSAGQWYPAAGGSDDFAFGAVGVPYSYTMEISDQYEFTYPQHLLSSLLPPNYEGFKVFASEIANEFGIRRFRNSKNGTAWS